MWSLFLIKLRALRPSKKSSSKNLGNFVEKTETKFFFAVFCLNLYWEGSITSVFLGNLRESLWVAPSQGSYKKWFLSISETVCTKNDIGVFSSHYSILQNQQNLGDGLTQFSPIFHFYIPWKCQNEYQRFSNVFRGVEMEHQVKMG